VPVNGKKIFLIKYFIKINMLADFCTFLPKVSFLTNQKMRIFGKTLNYFHLYLFILGVSSEKSNSF